MSDSALGACFANRPKPLRKVKSNAAPTLRALDDTPLWCLGELSESDILDRAANVLGDREFIDWLLAVYEETKTVYAPSEHVEQQIYGNFATPPDNQLMERFHVAPWQERHLLIPQFADQKYGLLAARVIHAEHPDHLPNELRQSVRAHIQSRVFFDGECDWGTVSKAIAECDEKLPNAEGEQAEMLTKYRDHLASLST